MLDDTSFAVDRQIVNTRSHMHIMSYRYIALCVNTRLRSARCVIAWSEIVEARANSCGRRVGNMWK